MCYWLTANFDPPRSGTWYTLESIPIWPLLNTPLLNTVTFTVISHLEDMCFYWSDRTQQVKHKTFQSVDQKFNVYCPLFNCTMKSTLGLWKKAGRHACIWTSCSFEQLLILCAFVHFRTCSWYSVFSWYMW